MEKIKVLYLLLSLVLLPCYADEVTSNSLPSTPDVQVESNFGKANEENMEEQDDGKAPDAHAMVNTSEKVQEPAEASVPIIENPKDILELRPFVITPKKWVPYAVLGLFLFFLFLAYLVLTKRKQKVISIIPLSPYDRALHEIEVAREWIHESQPKRFASALSDAVREYMGSVFAVKAIESTTEEFLREIQPLENLDTGIKMDLKVFLEGCDVIKFTKQTCLPQGREELYSAAKQLVNRADKIRQAQAMAQSDNASIK